MLTETGMKYAGEQTAKTIAFFDELLKDLEHWGIAAFERRSLAVEGDFRSRKGDRVHEVQVTIVMPRACPDCGAPMALSHRSERGLKCDMLKARFACQSCDYARDISFCLPVLA
jgi:hypothetical protein